jgi:hypothetical protein
MTSLRQRFIEDLQLRNRSPRTIETYVFHLKEYALYFNHSPDQLNLDHAHRYILYLLGVLLLELSAASPGLLDAALQALAKSLSASTPDGCSWCGAQQWQTIWQQERPKSRQGRRSRGRGRGGGRAP